MKQINKQLSIKYKLAKSVFESINAAAYATQARPLGTTTHVINTILSHPTFCDYVLPILIGNNKLNSDWERDKKDYISSIQLSIPAKGYTLNLNAIFDMEDARFRANIDALINEKALYKVIPAVEAVPEVRDNAGKVTTPKVEAVEEKRVNYSENEIVDFILSKVEPIDYHKYFRFVETAHYLYWIVALYSSQVANTPEDAPKSPNIRFFIYDDKVAHKADLENANMQSRALNKLMSIKNTSGGDELIKNIALVKNVITFDYLEEMDSETIYLEVFKYANTSPSEFLQVADNKDLAIELNIRKYMSVGILITSDTGNIVEARNQNSVIGGDVTSAISWFKNPMNKGEVIKFESEYKQLKS